MENFEIKLEGREFEVFVEYDVEIDEDWGSDADGRGGKTVYFVQIDSLDVWETKGGEIEKVLEAELLAKVEEKVKERIIEEWKENN